jgi:hypothetical protein
MRGAGTSGVPCTGVGTPMLGPVYRLILCRGLGTYSPFAVHVGTPSAVVLGHERHFSPRPNF